MAFRANIPTTKTQTGNILGVIGIWKHWGVSNAIRCSTPTCFTVHTFFRSVWDFVVGIFTWKTMLNVGLDFQPSVVSVFVINEKIKRTFTVHFYTVISTRFKGLVDTLYTKWFLLECGFISFKLWNNFNNYIETFSSLCLTRLT